MSLYEGTNGIQANDLLGRKMRVGGGAPFKAFMAEISDFCSEHRGHPELGGEIQTLSKVVARLGEVATTLGEKAKSDPLQWASYTYPALLCFGDAIMVWRLMDMAVIASKAVAEKGKSDYLAGKIMQATYFAGVTLPLTVARLDSCLRSGREIVEMPDGAF
jgi:Acetyl-CoA dehydrogenase C-terminal like